MVAMHAMGLEGSCDMLFYSNEVIWYASSKRENKVKLKRHFVHSHCFRALRIYFTLNKDFVWIADKTCRRLYDERPSHK